MIYSRRRTFLMPALLVVLCGCDKRSPEEKGRDYADEKLGFVEGAADELAKRGKNIGDDLGKGVGELVKGTGSAVKDVAHPAVQVVVSDALHTAGISVGQANEGEDTSAGREVVLHIKSAREFDGKLSLTAKGETLASALSAQELHSGADEAKVLRFVFDTSVRLSKIKSFELSATSDHQLSVAESVTAAGIKASQLTEKQTDAGWEVSVYVIFDQPFKKRLSLRAYTAGNDEVGRSVTETALQQDADSAGYFSFAFDPRVPMARVKRFELTLSK